MRYNVTFKIEARYIARVDANNVKNAIKKAESCFEDADFGEAEDIDGNALIVEDQKGDFVWEANDEA